MRSLFTRKSLRSLLASTCLLLAAGCGEGVDEWNDWDEELPVEETEHQTDEAALWSRGALPLSYTKKDMDRCEKVVHCYWECEKDGTRYICSCGDEPGTTTCESDPEARLTFGERYYRR